MTTPVPVGQRGELLRRAADKLDELLFRLMDAATEWRPTPNFLDSELNVVSFPEMLLIAGATDSDVRDYVVTMNPTVGRALVALFRSMASVVDVIPDHRGDDELLAVAQAILRGKS